MCIPKHIFTDIDILIYIIDEIYINRLNSIHIMGFN